MARFVFANDGGLDQAVTLQAQPGDELSVDEVQAWAAVRAATALDAAVTQLNLIASRLDEISDKLEAGNNRKSGWEE